MFKSQILTIKPINVPNSGGRERQGHKDRLVMMAATAAQSLVNAHLLFFFIIPYLIFNT